MRHFKSMGIYGFSWNVFILLFRVELWNIHTWRQYSIYELTNAFIIDFHFSKLRKLDNRARALSFWLALTQILFSSPVKHSLLSINDYKQFLFCIVSS